MTAPPNLEARIERGDPTSTIVVQGEIDYGSVARLRSALVELSQGDIGEVLIDMTGVTFIDSTGLSVLVQAKQRFESRGGRMSLLNPQSRVSRVLELAGLNDYLVGG